MSVDNSSDISVPPQVSFPITTTPTEDTLTRTPTADTAFPDSSSLAVLKRTVSVSSQNLKTWTAHEPNPPIALTAAKCLSLKSAP